MTALFSWRPAVKKKWNDAVLIKGIEKWHFEWWLWVYWLIVAIVFIGFAMRIVAIKNENFNSPAGTPPQEVFQEVKWPSYQYDFSY